MNTLLEMINDKIQEDKQEFIIDTDRKAEWALMKIREEKAESQRLINLCNSEIIRYQAALKKAQDALESKTGYMKAKLLEYFQTVPRKTSKTQETYKLPSGTLKMKFPAPEYVKDEDKLTEWLKKMGYTD